MMIPCTVCGKSVDISGMKQPKRNGLQHGKGRVFCSEECRIKAGNFWTEERKDVSRQRIIKINKEQASERMKKSNPSKNKNVQEKISSSLRSMGHKPPVRGGNGCGPTIPQRMMADALKELIPLMEYAVPTKVPRGNGYPTCYKLDIAIPEIKLGIEVDGNSHCPIERQKQDQKKDSLLATLGWTVLRFKNKQVMEHTEDCVRTVMSTISKLKETITISQTA